MLIVNKNFEGDSATPARSNQKKKGLLRSYKNFQSNWPKMSELWRVDVSSNMGMYA